MPKKKVEKTQSCHSHTKGCYVVKGILLLIFAWVLWAGTLSLAQVFAIIFAIVGIKKLIWGGKCGCHH